MPSTSARVHAYNMFGAFYCVIVYTWSKWYDYQAFTLPQ